MTEMRFFRKIIIILTISFGAMFVTSCTSQGVTSIEQEKPDTSPQTLEVDITFEGGSGKAYIKSPVEITKTGDELVAKFVWSSKNYDYMIVNGVKYENENNGGESTFTVPIDTLEEPLTVIGDTVAMSTPHEIEYVITWNKDGEDSEENADTSNMVKVSNVTIEGFTAKGELELDYATGFKVTRYDDFDLVKIENSGNYLLIDEEKTPPLNLPDEVTVIKKPADRTYLVSTSAMDLIDKCGALSDILLSGTRESDWYVDEAKEAMARGDLIYAGKYRAPDYELILEKGCNLAIANTMIYHEPAVKAKLEELGIPVLVETSSYESHPLGRLEWIKLYGVLFNKEKEAEDYFNRKIKELEPILNEKPDTGEKVAFFHVTAAGMINVRKPGDYITKMIEMAGGHYFLEDDGDSRNALSSMNMQMEDFYEKAGDADIIIYNSTIGGEIASIDDLLDKNPLFKDFKAVKEGRVYCTERNFFQQTTGLADFIIDLNEAFNEREEDFTYINKLD